MKLRKRVSEIRKIQRNLEKEPEKLGKKSERNFEKE